MKKWWGVLCFLILVGWVHAEISVKSFRKLETDMTARIDAAKKDQNGDVCAIIKVVTTQSGFVWEPDGLGIVSAVPKTGEYWLYVPYGAKRLTIKHPQLGILRDYMYSIPIEKACVYELELVTGRVETTVVEEIASQWLVIKSNVANSTFYINDEWNNNGSESQLKLKSGKYSYRVEAPMYHSEAGVVEIVDSKQEIKVQLKPAFGYLQINTMPESGASILIDEKPINGVTPLKTEALPSGEHLVQVMKDMYVPAREKVVVKDGETVAMNMVMSPSYAELSITSIGDATLKINGMLKGNTPWHGRLAPGVYSLEAQLDKHRTAKQDIELVVGDHKTVELKPVPIVGSLDVMTSPSGASISIDGKDYGTTPVTINKLLIGDYIMQISMTGYASVSKTVTITEGNNTSLNEPLSNGKQVNITSDPEGDELYIDNQRVGKTPYSTNLIYGKHILRVENNGKQNEKSIEVTAVSSPDVEVTKMKIGYLYAGGIVFYIDESGARGLVVAPTDQSTGIAWCNGSDTTRTNTTEIAIGSGKANTQQIIASQGFGDYAAYLCANMTLNGYHDWFLPSIDELVLMNKNLKELGVGQIRGSGVGNLDFFRNYYWSSTEISASQANCYPFRGNGRGTIKTNTYFVRAVREFEVNPRKK